MSSNLVKLLQNPSEIFLLVKRDSDGKLSLVDATHESSELLSQYNSLVLEGAEAEFLHLQLSEKGYGIVRPALKSELHPKPSYNGQTTLIGIPKWRKK